MSRTALTVPPPPTGLSLHGHSSLISDLREQRGGLDTDLKDKGCVRSPVICRSLKLPLLPPGGQQGTVLLPSQGEL